MPMHFLGLAGTSAALFAVHGSRLPEALIPCIHSSPSRRSSPAAAQFIFLINLFWSMFKGKRAPENPWESTSLGVDIPSPPPFDNFAGVHPVVYHGAYEYGEMPNGKDHVMQTEPLAQPSKK